MKTKTILETARLILRPFKRGDADDLYEYLGAPTMNCFLSMKLADRDAAVKGAVKRSRDRLGMYLAICLKDGGKVIGEVFADKNEHERDTYFPCWMLNSAFQGQGYGYEAMQAFIDYLFAEKSARRIYVYTEDYNLPCQKLCEKLGMRREGLFVELTSFTDNPDGTPKYENTYQYAILKKEWVMR